tara:strand:- start:3273 stop:3584 length:312 start_codon:yes stop_codon:yes gene_type:complete
MLERTNPFENMIGDILGYQVNIVSDTFGEMTVLYVVPHKGRYCNKTYLRIAAIQEAVAAHDTDKMTSLLIQFNYPHIFVSSSLSIKEGYEAIKAHVSKYKAAA